MHFHDFFKICLTIKVYPILLPQKILYLCLPIDFGPAGQLKKAFNQSISCTNLILDHKISVSFPFLQAYIHAKKEFMAEVNILNSWGISGIFS